MIAVCTKLSPINSSDRLSKSDSWLPVRIEEGWNHDKALAANILVGVIRGKERLRAQRTAFHRRDARQQSKLFARWNQSLTHSPNSNRLCSSFCSKFSLPAVGALGPLEDTNHD